MTKIEAAKAAIREQPNMPQRGLAELASVKFGGSISVGTVRAAFDTMPEMAKRPRGRPSKSSSPYAPPQSVKNVARPQSVKKAARPASPQFLPAARLPQGATVLSPQLSSPAEHANIRALELLRYLTEVVSCYGIWKIPNAVETRVAEVADEFIHIMENPI